MGFAEKVAMRIIDNIQIQIKNIHIRFENSIVKEQYSFGVTLAELRVFTTDI